MKLQERTIQSKLRYWAKQTRTEAGIGPPADVLDEAADRLEQSQALAEERLVSIGHWKAANGEAQRERDEARTKLSLVERVLSDAELGMGYRDARMSPQDRAVASVVAAVRAAISNREPPPGPPTPPDPPRHKPVG